MGKSDNIQFIPNQLVRKQLAKKLNLKFHDAMQDWEYEVANQNRVQEFIDEYDKKETSESEKESLMEIILDSANDLLLNKKQSEFEGFIHLISSRLQRNKNIHQGTLNYWKGGGFEISDKLRMGKSDKSLHNISIAAIKRHTIKPYDFKWTKFYESNSAFIQLSGHELHLIENELIICSTIVDSEKYSILTTQRLITNEAGVESVGYLIGSTNMGYGDFKGYKNAPLTFGSVQHENGVVLNYFIETGRASMVMISGVKTLLQTQRMTEKNVENVTRVWNRQNGK